MKGKIAVMITSAVLAMSAATLPASATVSNTTAQSPSGKQEQPQVLPKTGSQSNTKTQSPSGKQQPQVLPKTGSQVNQQKWSLDVKGAKIGRLTQPEKAMLNKFELGIKQGLSPVQAAQKVGNAKLIKLKGTNDQYQIRLSRKAHATFQVNGQSKVVKVLHAGADGKTAPVGSRIQSSLQR